MGVHGVMLKQSNQERYQLLAVNSLRSRVLCAHMILLKKASIGWTLYHTDSKDGSHSNSWNYEDHDFDYKLDQWGVEKLFQNSDEAITTELKFYIEYWEKLNTKNKSQVSK